MNAEHHQLMCHRSLNVRAGRKNIKAIINWQTEPGGLREVANLVEYPSGHVPGMPVGDLLISINGIGTTKVRQLLAKAHIEGPHRTVSQLRPGQRLELASVLRQRALALEP